MPKETPAQQRKVGKVMHEFKHGELHSGGGGRTVKNPKQAIAIALHEAGVPPKKPARAATKKSAQKSAM